MTQMRSTLRDGIERWLESRKNSSLSVLSKLSGVSYSTVRRCISEEYQYEPSLEVALAIASIVYDMDECNEFLSEFFPCFSKWMGKYDFKKSVTQEDFSSEIASHLVDKDRARVVAVAATEDGTSRQAVRDLLGSEGLRVLDGLLEEKLLFEGLDGRISTCEKTFSIISPENVLGQITLWTSLYDFSNLNTENYASYQFVTEGLNDKGLRAIADAKLRHANELVEIGHNKDFLGNKVVYSASFHNVLGES